MFARLATCDYQAGQYGPWENLQKATGLTPAREVEKSLRWDGVSYSGLGCEIVTAPLAEQSGHKEIRSR